GARVGGRAGNIKCRGVGRSQKADRRPGNTAAPVFPKKAPRAGPARAAAAPPPFTQAKHAAPANRDLPTSAPAAPAIAAMDAHHEEKAPAPAGPVADPAAPAVEGATAPQVAQPPAPPQTKIASAADEEDAAWADKPPEIPAPGETEYGSASSLSGMSFLDADAADRSSTIYFGAGTIGSPSKLQSWAPGAEPILIPPAAELAAQSADSNIK